MAELTPVIEEFTERLKSTQSQMQELLVENKSQMYEVLKRTLKWLVLKEIQDEGYLPRVMEKLILELNQKQNLIIKVPSSDLAPVKEMIAELEKKVGELTNVRLEPSLEMQGRGVIIETENSLLDASPEALFLTLDKLFEQALGHESKT
jgi:flagellar biosynthesis/type III secretory pathway protein FliH